MTHRPSPDFFSVNAPSISLRRILICFAAFSLPAFFSQAGEKFEPREGDRIALVGDTLIEREQQSGWLETVFYRSFPDRHFIVRNVGWSADTPAGESRAGFDFTDANKGFQQLTNQIAEVKPTVVFLGYGMANSFDGPAGVEKFKSDLVRLIDAIAKNSTHPVRFVLLSPIRHLKMPAPLPDPDKHNEQLSFYAKAVGEIAAQKNGSFVDLFDWKPGRAEKISDNGIHLNSDGYRLLAEQVAGQVGWKNRTTKWDEQIRQIAIRKNSLFFDRWRPQNETYLFGFRKHEQGQNAKEIPQFDPLVSAQDEKIFALQNAILKKGRTGAPPVREGASLEQSLSTKPKSEPHPDFTIGDGLQVNLFAEDPLLAKPIQMNFDPQGRLWIASSAVYPQIAPGQKADDKILILEDRDGDGRAEKSTVFADGLFVPTGVAPGDGGCYVGQSTELLYLKDTNGDGKADQRRVVLSGFGTEDTHHMVHTLRWSHDGMLYFDQSIYIHSHLETPHGVVRLNSGGIFHLRPPTMETEIFLRGFCNPWGHAFDEFGQSFVTDGAGSQGISFGIRDATYFTYASMRRELKSVSPGSYPKFCGLENIRSQHFPADWQGNFITPDFRAHRVVRFSITEEGAGYVTKEMPDVLRTTNVTFRPIDVKIGPDGALYVADWSNPIINHGEVDFRDPRRDHEHGRIWRITAKGRPLLPKINFTKLSNEKLFEQLLSPNAFNQEQARRVLTERGKKIESDLRRWTKKQTDEKALLEVLWMYQAIDLPNDELLRKILAAKDGRIRAAGVRVLSFWQNRSADSLSARTGVVDGTRGQAVRAPIDLLASAVGDSHPRVRLEAVRALGKIPSARSAELVLSALDNPTDNFLEYAIWLSINELAKPWLEAVRSGAWKVEGREKQLEYGLKAVEPELASAALTELLKMHPLARDGSGPWIELIGRSGTAKELQLLFDKVLAKGFTDAATLRALTALNDAARTRKIDPADHRPQIKNFFDHASEKIRVEAIRLAGAWKCSDKCVPKLIELVSTTSTSTTVRDATFSSLREIGGERVADGLQPLVTTNQPTEIRRPAILALAAIDLSNAAPATISFLRGTTNEDDALTIWRSLLGNKDATQIFSRALPASGFPRAAGKAGLRAARELARREPEFILAISRAAGLEDAEKTLTAEEMKELAASVSSRGDAARGEKIYRRREMSCASCHAIAGVGGKVGPDLTSIGASAPVDYLIESVFYPNKMIKEGFHAAMIETTDGDQFSGVFVRENDREVILRDASNKEISVLKKDIKSRTTGGSLMPSGLADALSEQDRLNLFRFLSELGKPGPFDASKANVARAWKIAAGSHRTEQFGDEKIVASPFSDKCWQPLASLVDGRLVREELKAAAGPEKGTITTYAGTEFRVTQSGKVRLNLSEAPGISAWVDDKPVSVNGPISVELPSGAHRLIVKFDFQKIPENFRVDSPDVVFLAN